MTNDVRVLAEMIERHGAPVVETAGWRLAARVDETLAETVEGVLAAEGAWGLVDLVLVGSALGGLGEAHVARLVSLVEARVNRHALAA
ncbi:hypothetical protein [Microbacterium sp. LWS13-1.2]|uniref:Uncharacterized protein n=1 Tax=Microbacterium sp. LWS13-1.2 TaxID=3135264 RepID=A0AAU6SGM7_9MICO